MGFTGFTFQYGSNQIVKLLREKGVIEKIYIPIWF